MDGNDTVNLYVLRDSNPDAFAKLVGQLRDAARAHAESTSLRQAAREIGMSPTGLHNFIVGTAPYLTTVRKLHECRGRTYLARST